MRSFLALALLPLLACGGSEPTPVTPVAPPPPAAPPPVAPPPPPPVVAPPPAAAAPAAVDKLLKVGTTGTPDKTWGTSGVASLSVNAELVSADGSGGLYVFMHEMAASTGAGGHSKTVAVVHYSSTGVKDAAFGQNGQLSLGAAGTSLVQGVTLDGKGRVVLLTSHQAPAAKKPSLVAYRLAGGKLDSTFNNGGASTVTIPTPAITSQTGAVAIGADRQGRIVIAGTDDPASKRQVFVVRLAENGSIDPSFARGVAVNSQSNNGFDVAGVTVDQTNGSVVVVANKSVTGGIVTSGSETAPAGSGIAVFRFDSNGMVDGKFGTAGVALVDDAGAAGLDVTSDKGSIVVGGYTGNTPEKMKPMLVRWNENGTLDSGFGSGGKLVLAGAGGTLGRVKRVTRDGTGRFVVVGSYRTGQDSAVTFVTRLDAKGQLDSSYGTAGTASFNVQSQHPEIDPQGSVFFRAP